MVPSSGSADPAAAAVNAHLQAGADHVAVQVLTAEMDLTTRSGPLPVEGWRALAGVLSG